VIIFSVFSMPTFFEFSHNRLIHRPNGCDWWHSMPLPNGNRIAGAHADCYVQLKLWENLCLDTYDLVGKRVLDIGANDGFFTIAALLAGADKVTAINTGDRPTYPENLLFAAKQWDVAPEVVVDDFQVYPFDNSYEVVLFLGVLYHLENIFAAARRLHELMDARGTLYLETQMTLIESSLPIYEAASDIYPTVAKQYRAHLHTTGRSNFLFPNEAAVQKLALSYNFTCERLKGAYTRDYPSRGVFRLTKLKE
jgi:2-polyprenyl-3-methyl-5-hydroxy-6-metoxy-1,4-benzoquinol methylase